MCFRAGCVGGVSIGEAAARALALTAEVLRDFQLLVILCDGMNWPNGYDQPAVEWMTDAQQQAIFDFRP